MCCNCTFDSLSFSISSSCILFMSSCGFTCNPVLPGSLTLPGSKSQITAAQRSRNNPLNLVRDSSKAAVISLYSTAKHFTKTRSCRLDLQTPGPVSGNPSSVSLVLVTNAPVRDRNLFPSVSSHVLAHPLTFLNRPSTEPRSSSPTSTLSFFFFPAVDSFKAPTYLLTHTPPPNSLCTKSCACQVCLSILLQAVSLYQHYWGFRKELGDASALDLLWKHMWIVHVAKRHRWLLFTSLQMPWGTMRVY